VAVVEARAVIDGRAVVAGDRILAVASSGVHSNGFSLVRRILDTQAVDDLTRLPGSDQPLLEALLTPTRLYGSLVKALLAAGLPIHGMAHITGGGLPENLPRCLPAGVHAVIDPASWQRPALFDWLQQAGEVPEADLWNTFNLGVGYCLVIPETALDATLAVCAQSGYSAWALGRVAAGEAPQAGLAGLPQQEH
jgi:phosphoribosylformylglycinamidine cyclo-ligase